MSSDRHRAAVLGNAIASLLDAAAHLGSLEVGELTAERRAYGWAAARRASVASAVIEELIVEADREQSGRAPVSFSWSGRLERVLRRQRERSESDAAGVRADLDRHQHDLERWEAEMRRHADG